MVFSNYKPHPAAILDSNTKRNSPINIENKLSLYLKEISKLKQLTTDQVVDLIPWIQLGSQEALDTLVQANLKFVVAVCRNYQNQGMPLVDLISEGNMGLIKAAMRFDVNKNCKFISYAVWWIRQSILQSFAEQCRTIKLPVNKIGAIHDIKKASSRLEQKLGRTPTTEEISQESSIDLEKVKKCQEINYRHISIDHFIETGENDQFSDVGEVGDNQGIYRNDLNKEISQTLESLRPREREVLKLYFGLNLEVEYTLDEIAERFGLTRERVRQIKEKALDRLKHTSRAKKLEQFIAE